MTIPQLFIVGYAFAFVVGAFIGGLSRQGEVNRHIAIRQAMAAASLLLIDLLKQRDAKISRLTNPPRDKNGRFK